MPRVIPLKNYKRAKGIPLNCGKGLKPRVGHGVTCTSICLVLRSFTVENQLAELLFLHRASLLCCIDNFFTNFSQDIVDPTIIVSDLSDHFPILLWFGNGAHTLKSKQI